MQRYIKQLSWATYMKYEGNLWLNKKWSDEQLDDEAKCLSIYVWKYKKRKEADIYKD